MAVYLMGIAGPSALQAASSKKPDVEMADIKDASPEVQAIVKRFEEIKAMDFKKLTPEQRKAVKQELKEIKQNKVVTGVYLSVGAIIIILLILLLIL